MPPTTSTTTSTSSRLTRPSASVVNRPRSTAQVPVAEPADRDAGQLQRRADPGGQVVGLLVQQPDHLAARPCRSRSSARRAQASTLHSRHPDASRSSSVSRRTITPRLAVAHRDHRRPRDVVVVAGHAPAVGPGARAPRPDLRARTSAGRNSSFTTMSPVSQCFPTTRASIGGASRPGGQRRRVVGVVQGGADVVAHPAVHAHVRPDRRRASLTVPTSYRVNMAGPTIARPGSTDSCGTARPAAAHSSLDDLAQPLGQLGRRRRVVAAVVYAMPKPPPRSSSGSSTPCASRICAEQADHPAGGDLEAGGVEDLRADVRVQPDAAPARPASSTRRRGLGARRRRPARSRTSGPRARWR